VSADAANWAKRIKVGNKTTKAVLRELADVASADGRAYPLVWSIATVVEVDERTVIRALNALVELGLIRHESWITPAGSTKRRPVYRLDMPEASPFCPEKNLKIRGGNQPNRKDKGCQDVTLADAQGCQDVTSKGDTVSPPRVTPVSPKTSTLNSSEAIASSPGVGAPDDVVRIVEAIWAVWPEFGRLTSSKRKLATVIADEVATGAVADQLIAAAAAYAANRNAWGSSGKPKAVADWFAEGRWEGFVPAADAPSGSPGSGGGSAVPEAVRAAFWADHGEAARASYLDPCGWRDEDQTLLARTGAAERWLHGKGYRVERLIKADGVR
jgi:hypothetical protein